MTKGNLITGATGIVGIHLMLKLLKRDEKVRAMARQSSDRSIVDKVFAHYGAQQLAERIEWVVGDMLDGDSLMLAMNGCKRVFHTAAMVSFAKSDHARLWQTNVEGTATLVDCAIQCGIESLCHVSSIGALGHEPQGYITEDTQWQPESNRSVYSQSKFRQEMEAWRGMECGLKVVIVNPGVVLGPGIAGRSSQQIIDTVAKGTPFYVEGETGYIDARDLAHAMFTLTEQEKWGERYIVVGHNCRVRRLQELFAEALGTKAPTIKASKRLMMTAAFFSELWARMTGGKSPLTIESARSMGGSNSYSSEKLINTINIQFTPLEESVRNMADFFRH